MTRILSKDGNVISADFRPPAINLQFKSQLLYCDELICLLRITYLHDGKIVGTQHITAAIPSA